MHERLLTVSLLDERVLLGQFVVLVNVPESC